MDSVGMVLPVNMDNSNITTTTTQKENKTFVFVNNSTISNATSTTTAATATTVAAVKMKNNGGSAAMKRSRAAADSSDNNMPPELMRCKRRINFAQLGYSLPQAQPTAVARRNERERNRVKLVNLGFATLREHVPNGSKNKKMSKVETLRSAVEYIRKLQELLDDTDGALHDLFAAAAAADSVSSSSAGSPLSSSSSQQSENMLPMNNAATTVNTNNLSGLCYSNRTGVVSNTGANSNNGNGGGIVTCPPSSVSPGCSAASSPTPSYASDCSYEPLSPEEEELLDFTSWFT